MPRQGGMSFLHINLYLILCNHSSFLLFLMPGQGKGKPKLKDRDFGKCLVRQQLKGAQSMLVLFNKLSIPYNFFVLLQEWTLRKRQNTPCICTG